MRGGKLSDDPDLFITWDPGFGGTGFALFSRTKRGPLKTGVIRPPGAGMDLEYRATYLYKRVSKVIQSLNPDRCVVEWPAYFHGSAAGQAAAGSGDLMKLTLAASVVFCASANLRIPCDLLPVNDWKGQLSKKVVIYRVKGYLGEDKCTQFKDHVWDAVGMGLSIKGTF